MPSQIIDGTLYDTDNSALVVRTHPRRLINPESARLMIEDNVPPEELLWEPDPERPVESLYVTRSGEFFVYARTLEKGDVIETVEDPVTWLMDNTGVPWEKYEAIVKAVDGITRMAPSLGRDVRETVVNKLAERKRGGGPA